MARKPKIPRIIHQIWLGDQSKRPAALMKTWEDAHPDWEYRLWTDHNLPELRNAAQFEEMPQLAGKADILRYELLHTHGGVYLDADSICLRPIDDLLDADSFCCFENEKVRPGLLHNGFLGACQGNELMNLLVTTIGRMPTVNFGPRMAWKVTGPMLLTKVVERLNYRRIVVHPSWYFLPEHYTGTRYTGEGKPYSRHYWGSTPWQDEFEYKGQGLQAPFED